MFNVQVHANSMYVYVQSHSVQCAITLSWQIQNDTMFSVQAHDSNIYSDTMFFVQAYNSYRRLQACTCSTAKQVWDEFKAPQY